eukprot:3046943-Pleurochrysis_carterae.AAC.1
MAQAGLCDPTPLQRSAIPVSLAGRDSVVVAAVEAGQPACLLLPLINPLLSAETRGAGKSGKGGHSFSKASANAK